MRVPSPGFAAGAVGFTAAFGGAAPADFADGENESLRRINDGAERIDAHAAEIRDGETSALKLLRLHPLVARATGKVLCQFADFAQRFVLRGADHRRE